MNVNVCQSRIALVVVSPPATLNKAGERAEGEGGDQCGEVGWG